VGPDKRRREYGWSFVAINEQLSFLAVVAASYHPKE